MSKKMMLINSTDDESRIAIVDNNILQEMLIEHRSREQLKGNIYKAVAVQIQTSLQAAFVDFGLEKHGFLPKNEINPALYSNKNSSQRNSIQSRLRVGQPVMVQVTREAVDNKGAALTTNVSLPGRFMVLMPHSDKGGVSRKIEDATERDRLKGFLSGIQSEEHAVIIRTAGVGRSLIELKKDYTNLKRKWESIKNNYDAAQKASLIHEEDDVVIRTLRDYYSEDIEEIWVDNPEVFQKALEFMKDVAPRRQNDLRLFVDERSLFATYKIEKQVEQLTLRSVPLKSGGSIVIDQTEALVAIDVNSGRSNQEKSNDSTAQRTNLEAAEEILRQLRLRNLGGLIVIDFIDMEMDSARKKVEDLLHAGKSGDKAKLSFSEISKFGLMEMSRQRLSVGISRTVESTCPTCDGKGSIPTQLAATNLIIRCVREIAAKGNVLRIEVVLPLDLANYLHNKRRESIMDLELEFGIKVYLTADPNLVIFDESQIKTFFKSKKSQVTMVNPTLPHKPKQQEKEKQKGRKKEPSANIQEKEPTPTSAETTKTEPTPKVATKEGKSELKTSTKETRKKTDLPRYETSVDQDKYEEPVDQVLATGCLFKDVEKIEEEKLDEITKAFRNRLKGKINNEAPLRIGGKYLWRQKEDIAEKKEQKEKKQFKGQSKTETDSKTSKPKEKTASSPTKKETKSVAKKTGKSTAKKSTKPATKKSSSTGTAQPTTSKKRATKAAPEKETAKVTTKKNTTETTAREKTANKAVTKKKVSRENAAKKQQKTKSGEKDTAKKTAGTTKKSQARRANSKTKKVDKKEK